LSHMNSCYRQLPVPSFPLPSSQQSNQHRSSSALEVKRREAQTGSERACKGVRGAKPLGVIMDVLTIGEVAARSGVATSALRFYEDQGLIASERNDSGHRRYPRSVLRRVAFIVFAQRIGLSLEEIGAELAKLPRNRAPERPDWARLSSSWTRRIDERIAELERMKTGLTECIGCGCLSLDRCQFANP